MCILQHSSIQKSDRLLQLFLVKDADLPVLVQYYIVNIVAVDALAAQGATISHGIELVCPKWPGSCTIGVNFRKL